MKKTKTRSILAIFLWLGNVSLVSGDDISIEKILEDRDPSDIEIHWKTTQRLFWIEEDKFSLIDRKTGSEIFSREVTIEHMCFCGNPLWDYKEETLLGIFPPAKLPINRSELPEYEVDLKLVAD